MKHSVRSAAAVITASVLGGAGMAAAAGGFIHPDSGSATNGQSAVGGPSESAALGAVNDLVSGTSALDTRLADARRELAREVRLLQHQRSLAKAGHSAGMLAGGVVSSPLQGTGVSSPVSTPPPAHTTTGASGTGAPPTHTRTGASGSGSGQGGDGEGGHDD